ncbi:MAG: hypothetical protein HPY65_09365 [Syntrophaceae bacterium]|nr:hypothetical protein [Syntrophaceae bacterium]
MDTINMKAEGRIDAIDFSKGILVFFMVVYHSLNHLKYGSLPHEYMAFLPPSFIMITGFIITQIYLPKYRLDANGFRTRLASRALKLLLIFTFLNLLARMMKPKFSLGYVFELEDYWADCLSIYVIGSPKMVAFEVLLPISYILLLSIVISMFKLFTPIFISIFTMFIFGLCIFLKYHGISIYNLSFISFGLIGMAVGFIPLLHINQLSKRWTFLFLLLVLYGFIYWGGGDYYHMQILSALISILIFYVIGCKTNAKYSIAKLIILLGQYSLFSYIIQILYIRLFVSLTATQTAKLNMAITIIIVTIVMSATVIILEYAREQSRVINRIYKVVFA